MQALEQLRRYLSEINTGFSECENSIFFELKRDGIILPVYGWEEKYGWVVLVGSFTWEDFEGELPPMPEFKTLVQDMFGGRLSVYWEGKRFTISGRIRTESDRIDGEFYDYEIACVQLIPFIGQMAEEGRWNPVWDQMVLKKETRGHA